MVIAMNVPDNYDMFLAHEWEMERRLARLPVCDCCGEPIQDEFFYEFDFKKICPSCLELNYRRIVEVEY